MSKFTSATPVENSTLAEAKNLVKQRESYLLACHGIFVNPQGSTTEEDYIPEADFEANKVDATKPVRLVVMRTPGKPSDEFGSMPTHGDYVNVGMQLDRLKNASSLQAGVIAMIEEDLTKSNVVFTPGEAMSRLASTPSVNKAIDAALAKEWKLRRSPSPSRRSPASRSRPRPLRRRPSI